MDDDLIRLAIPAFFLLIGVYGVTRPLASWNPLWANLHAWVEMPLDRLRVLWKRPGWRPDDLGGFEGPSEVDRATHVRYAVPLPLGARRYVLAQFALVSLGAVGFLDASGQLSPASRAAGALAIAFSLVSLGGLLDGRRWAAFAEAGRLLGAGLAAAVVPLPPAARAAAAVLVLGSSGWLLGMRKKGLPLPAPVR
jgi:hypothetical protein